MCCFELHGGAVLYNGPLAEEFAAESILISNQTQLDRSALFTHGIQWYKGTWTTPVAPCGLLRGRPCSLCVITTSCAIIMQSYPNYHYTCTRVSHPSDLRV
jgi:hypothetical protein